MVRELWSGKKKVEEYCTRRRRDLGWDVVLCCAARKNETYSPKWGYAVEMSPDVHYIKMGFLSLLGMEFFLFLLLLLHV